MKQIIKKLSFNKELLNPLNEQELHQLLGGGNTFVRAGGFADDAFEAAGFAGDNTVESAERYMGAMAAPYKLVDKI